MSYVRIPQPGELLDGKYKLLGLLGEGGFARVMRAMDARVQREVAVKFLLPGNDGAYDPSLKARFQREAKLLASLHDPHTLQLFDFGQTDAGAYYMVSELLPGTDLSTVLESRGRLNPEETTHVMLQLAHSLREAHRAGILHRDVKPSNIRIFEYDTDPLRVKLMDFGVARSIDDSMGSITSTGAHVGTLLYMSPEQLRGADLTAASDLFSLGLTAFEMLHGECKTARQAVFAARRPHVEAPEPLRTVITRLLEFDANDRFQTAQQVIDLLTPYDSKPGRAIQIEPPRPEVQSGPVLTPRSQSSEFYGAAGTSRESSRPYPAARPKFRVPLLAKVAVSSVLVGVAIAAIWSAFSRQPEPVTVVVTQPQQRAENPLAAPEPTPVEVAPDEPVEEPAPEAPVADAEWTISTQGCQQPYDRAGRQTAQQTSSNLGAREYQLYVPKGEPDEPRPLLVVFHTDSEDASGFFNAGRFAKLAEDTGAILALPHGAGLIAWESGFAADELRGVVEDVAKVGCVDPERIVLLGHGSGGIPAVDLSCEPWVAGVITTSYRPNVGWQGCRDRAVPYLAFVPNKSGHLPKHGGSNCTGTRQIASEKAEEDAWISRNSCGTKTSVDRSRGLRCKSWTSCEAPLTMCEVDGGHNWPGVKRRGVFAGLLNCDGPPVSADFHDPIGKFLKLL